MMKAGLLAALFMAFIFVAGYALSWAITCGLVKLITLCFGWNFSLGVTTGIWLIVCIITRIFRKH